MKLYLIDGNSYFYRAYHAIKDLSNSKGLPTNAIFGFTNMLFKIIRDKKPDAIAIIFDSPVPTKRHKIYDEYKAQRPQTPDNLIIQIPHIKEIINAFNIPAFEIAGYEADDIICSIAKKLASDTIEVFIVSSDKDMMQVISDHIYIYDPIKDSIIDRKYVIDRFGVSPETIPEFMAITGDAIDNIPGVKGIGEKTARQLFSKTGSLEEMLKHPEKIENNRLRKMIIENIETIKISKALATIETDIDISVSINDLKIREPDWERLLRLFTEFEFKSLIKLIPSGRDKSRGRYKTVYTTDELSEILGS